MKLSSVIIDATSGALVGLALQPIDTIKTRLQTGRGIGPDIFAGVQWAMISEAEEAVYTITFRNILLQSIPLIAPMFVIQIMATLLAETIGGLIIHCTSEGRKRYAQMGYVMSDILVSKWRYIVASRYLLLRRASVPVAVWSVECLAPYHLKFVYTTLTALICGFLASPFDTLYSQELSSLLPECPTLLSDKEETYRTTNLFSWYRGFYVAMYWGLLLPLNRLIKYV